MGFDQPTNAASSGVALDRKVLKSLARRSDFLGLRHLAIWHIRESTRSFTTNWFSRFIYANMCYHIEHHCYPMVPFHALPKLNAALRDQLPPPDRGLLRTNGLVFAAAWRRTFGGLRAVD